MNISQDVCSQQSDPIFAQCRSTFSDWTSGRQIISPGTNAGAPSLPFQGWRHFKEAYAPELVAQAVQECGRRVRRCIDPFGGSGTTALASQFLGVHPVTIEVNPFLADLIEAKLVSYDCDSLARDLGEVIGNAQYKSGQLEAKFSYLPKTFVEPGVNERWIFDRGVAERLVAYATAIQGLANLNHKRLFRVLLGGLLIQVSNVLISGKGRRYRRQWQTSRCDPRLVDKLFATTARQAITDIHRFRHRAVLGYDLHRGDCREWVKGSSELDLAVFSPPYPNSFDYTDVYNVELWMLGYLTDSTENKSLRESTISSHVQVARNYPSQPAGSDTLRCAIERLVSVRHRLWARSLPEMVGGYFADMATVLKQLSGALLPCGEVWMVVGDSCYDGVHIRSAKILAELSSSLGYEVKRSEPFRSMRVSPQLGGKPELAESLLVLKLAS